METFFEATSLKGRLQQTRVSLLGLKETDERNVDEDLTSQNGGSYFSSAKCNGRISDIYTENTNGANEEDEETTKKKDFNTD